MSAVIEPLEDDEKYLWAILSDESGLDLAELVLTDEGQKDRCFRAWPFQWAWWRCNDDQQIDQGSRSSGKSMSIRLRAFVFPFIHPQQTLVVTAPEGTHIQTISNEIEKIYLNNRLPNEMLKKGPGGIKHKPFEINFQNGATIMGVIPQRTGVGLKGCVVEGTLVLTQDQGYIPVEEIQPGDMVLTEQNRWMPVQQVRTGENECFEVKAQGIHPITVSHDHRFYGLAKTSPVWAANTFDFPGWYGVQSLIEDKVYLASQTEFPEVAIPEPEFNGTAIPFAIDQDDFWWLVGRYLADGYLTTEKKTGRGKRVSWVATPWQHDEITSRLSNLGLHYHIKQREFSSADIVSLSSAALNRWLEEYFGQHSDGKRLPTFVLGMKEKYRQALLSGYLSGDGHWSKERERFQVSSASKRLIVGVQMLAQSLGYFVNCSHLDPKVTSICGMELKSKPKRAWVIHISKKTKKGQYDGYHLGKVKSVESVGLRKVYNPVVEEDHSYISESCISHNLHPLWLEIDEGQDFPELAWKEVIETLQQGEDNGARWRVHGVTRGVQDKFYEFTKPDSGWTVHHYPAMYRPTWNAEERTKKIKLYGGSVEDPDFRRNVYGVHGDATSVLFVLYNLMACADQDEESDYNLEEYAVREISMGMVKEAGDIRNLLNVPFRHTNDYDNFWMGMDVGYTTDPSVIVIFGEAPPKKKGGAKRLKLLSKIIMKQIANPDQASAIMHLIEEYSPKAFAMDSTGAGLPLFQDIQFLVRQDASLRSQFDRIKGYNFSQKIVVGIDDSVEFDEYSRDNPDPEIKKNVLEYSTDVLRGMVDVGAKENPPADSTALWLPWDPALIDEFRGQTYTFSKTASSSEEHSRRRLFSQGYYHTLDACRMAALGYSQHMVDAELSTRKNKFVAVPTIFVG